MPEFWGVWIEDNDGGNGRWLKQDGMQEPWFGSLSDALYFASVRSNETR
jgi:hypothetical protein